MLLTGRVTLWVVEFGWIATVFGLIFWQGHLYRKRREIVLFIAVLASAFLAVEIILRVVDRRPTRFIQHHYLNYSGMPNYKSIDGLNEHNSLGFRGPEIVVPKPRGVYRIAILGGSTVYEEYVKDWRKDFARQLEAELRRHYDYQNIEIVNAGLPGWSSWEDLINLEFRLLDLDLDMIIVYEGTNDVHARLVKPDSYKADNSGWRKRWKSSLCLHLLCSKIIQRLTGLEMQGFNVEAATFGATEETGYSSILGTTPLETLKKNPPIFYERNLRNIIAIAYEQNMKVLLATWAYSDEFDDYAATNHYQVGFKAINEVIKQVGKTKSLPVYNFAGEMSKDKRYWVDGRHNNEEGVRLKAKLFAQFIASEKIIDNSIHDLRQ